MEMGDLIIVDFSKRGKDLRYLIQNELKPDRQWEKREWRIAQAIKQSNPRTNIRVLQRMAKVLPFRRPN